MIAHEKQEMALLSEANDWQLAAAEWEFAASIAHILRNFNVSPVGVGATFGGSNVGSALSAIATSFRARATDVTFEAGMSAKLGQFAMRTHDWTLQSNQAARDIMQIDKQIAAGIA